MYDFVKLYVIPTILGLLTAVLLMDGVDIFGIAAIVSPIAVVLHILAAVARDLYDAFVRNSAIAKHMSAMRDRRKARQVPVTTEPRHKDITLDDLNALLERIDRGEDGVPDTPLLTTNEERRLIGYVQRRSYAGDEVIVESVPVYTTFYADDMVYMVIQKPSAAVSIVTQTRR